MNPLNACGKQRHPTRQQAAAQRRWLSVVDNRRGKLEVYLCVCGFFHVGHVRRKKRRRAA